MLHIVSFMVTVAMINTNVFFLHYFMTCTISATQEVSTCTFCSSNDITEYEQLITLFKVPLSLLIN